MGMFDFVVFTDKSGETREIQFKFGDCNLIEYSIGDSVDFSDGIYFDYDGCFVVFNEVIVAAFDKEDYPIINKWGNYIDFPSI